MPTEEAFLQSLRDDPTDRVRRLIFADWLEERGDPRGELIRLTDILTKSMEVPGRERLESRLRDLVSEGVQPVGPYFTNSIGIRFAWIPAGTFLMGSPKEEVGRDVYESQHPVILKKGFYLGVHLVTQEQWQSVMGINPSDFKGQANLPVDSVSWEDCQVFIQRLQGTDGQRYDLPTEAQWEFACRAGTTTPFYFGQTISTDLANYDGTHTYGKGNKGRFRKETTVVGSFAGNAFGLYDMHGNLWEWCRDWHDEFTTLEVVDPQGPIEGEYKVLRGGSWPCNPRVCRSASRGYEPASRRRNLGVRLALCLD